VEITEKDVAQMEECLSGMKDERRQSGHFLYKLIDVLVIGLTTVIAGWDEFNVPELLDSLDVKGDTITYALT
jgi:hypothetical protein